MTASKPLRTVMVIVALAAFCFAPQVLPRFYVYLLAIVFINGLLATSLNLVLGFGGLYQFHHAVFYGAGAYAVALVLTKTGLPWIAAILAAPVAAAALSLLMGLICVRLSKLYFGMLQISLGSLVWTLVYRWYDFTGGDDGIHGIPMPDVFSSTNGAYYFSLGAAAVCLFLMHRIIRSPFGRALTAIRDNPERSRAVGIHVAKHQLAALTAAGFFAGVAGAAFVVVEGSVFPELMFWTLSLEIVIMCLLGGWFTFFGPMLGAAIMEALRTFVGAYTEYWTLVLGIVLMLLILLMPDGVLGIFQRRKRTAEDA